MTMDIHVYDTYVKAKDGHTMHFDVITTYKIMIRQLNMLNSGLKQLMKEMPKLQVKNANFVTHKGLHHQLKMRSKKRDSSFKKWKDVH